MLVSIRTQLGIVKRGFVDLGSSQYEVYTNNLIEYNGAGVKITYDDGTTQVRKRMVDSVPNELYIDITKTPTGFAGVEDTDWEWVNLRNLVTQGSLLANFRNGVRNGCFVTDAWMNTMNGFTGVEDTDWENLEMNCGGGVQTTFRDGVRNAAYVIDKALTATGFAGTEDVDWENLVELKIP